MIRRSLSNTNETCYNVQIAKICNLNKAQVSSSPLARDSWSGPCALLRLHGSSHLAWQSGTHHNTAARGSLAPAQRQRTRASQPDAIRPVAAAIFFGRDLESKPMDDGGSTSTSHSQPRGPRPIAVPSLEGRTDGHELRRKSRTAHASYPAYRPSRCLVGSLA